MLQRMQPRKLVGYLIISIFVTSLDIALLFVLVDLLNVYYLLGATVSYSSAVMTKFILNKISVFRTSEGIWVNQLARFWMVSISGLILTNIGMFVGVDIIGLSYILTKLGCVGVVFIWTFILHNVFSFGSTSNESKSGAGAESQSADPASN